MTSLPHRRPAATARRAPRTFVATLLLVAACGADEPGVVTETPDAVDAADGAADAPGDAGVDAVDGADAGGSDVAVADEAAPDAVGDGGAVTVDLGMGGDSETDGPEDAVDVPEPDASDPPPFDGPDLSGTWAQLQVTAARTQVPVVGEVEAVTRSVLRVTVLQDGPTVVATHETCSVDMDSGTRLVSTVVPRAFVESLPFATRTGTLAAGAAGWELVFPLYVEVRGADLDVPETDALPTSGDDPRVVDLDGDGNPGVTVRVSGLLEGEVYLVQRASNDMSAAGVTADEVAGPLRWQEEQSILGADNRLLLTANPSAPLNTPDKSYHVWIRVDDAETCASIVANTERFAGR